MSSAPIAFYRVLVKNEIPSTAPHLQWNEREAEITGRIIPTWQDNQQWLNTFVEMDEYRYLIMRPVPPLLGPWYVANIYPIPRRKDKRT